LIDAKINEYQTTHPDWKNQSISQVAEEITKEVKKDCPRLV